MLGLADTLTKLIRCQFPACNQIKESKKLLKKEKVINAGMRLRCHTGAAGTGGQGQGARGKHHSPGSRPRTRSGSGQRNIREAGP